MRGKRRWMERGVPRRRRPGPVVTEGVEALLLRGEGLAKGWLLALVEDAPLESAAAIMAGDVARDGPRICDAVVRAIYDEADLRRIEAGGVLEPLVSRAGELAGVRSSETAAHAVETLRTVIWSALRTELARTDPDVLADAGERLSLVTELVRAAVLRRQADGEAGGPATPRVPPLRVARTDVPAAPQRGEESATPGLAGTGGPVGAGGGAGGGFEDGRAVHDTDDAETATPAPGGFEPATTLGPEGVPPTRRWAEAPTPGPERAVDALWIGALRDEIVRAARSRLPLSLLLVELDEAERLLAAEPRGDANATFGRFAQAVRFALRHRDVLACETESRAWIIARDTGRTGAQALGSRIVTAVPLEESWRGAPLTVSVGLAVLGEDGHNAAALIDAAEQTRFAAEASGIGIVAGEPGDGEFDGDSEPPAGPSLVS
jgi:GGDEF domain-containing protein